MAEERDQEILNAVFHELDSALVLYLVSTFPKYVPVIRVDGRTLIVTARMNGGDTPGTLPTVPIFITSVEKTKACDTYRSIKHPDVGLIRIDNEAEEYTVLYLALSLCVSGRLVDQEPDVSSTGVRDLKMVVSPSVIKTNTIPYITVLDRLRALSAALQGREAELKEGGKVLDKPLL